VPVKIVFYHTVLSRFADGGDGRQMQRVTANILNKYWKISDKGWSYSFRVRWEVTTLYRKRKPDFYEMLHMVSKCLGSCEHGNEP